MAESESAFVERPRVLSLFSGIGGLDVGLEHAGMEVVAQSEIDPYASRVLRNHWPNVPNLGDATQINEFPEVEVIAGGFPCQDVSRAGRRAGLTGARSGLYGEIVRAIRMVRPRLALLENVATLVSKGRMGTVLGDMAGIGYDAEWDRVQAADVGAPHIRARQFITAYPGGRRHGTPHEAIRARRASSELRAGWASEPGVRRVDDGAPNRVDRMRALGNAVVPQCVELAVSRV